MERNGRRGRLTLAVKGPSRPLEGWNPSYFYWFKRQFCFAWFIVKSETLLDHTQFSLFFSLSPSMVWSSEGLHSPLVASSDGFAQFTKKSTTLLGHSQLSLFMVRSSEGLHGLLVAKANISASLAFSPSPSLFSTLFLPLLNFFAISVRNWYNLIWMFTEPNYQPANRTGSGSA